MNIKEWLMKNDLDNKTAEKILKDGIIFFRTIAKSKQTPNAEKIAAAAKIKETRKYLNALNAITE